MINITIALQSINNTLETYQNAGLLINKMLTYCTAKM